MYMVNERLTHGFRQIQPCARTCSMVQNMATLNDKMKPMCKVSQILLFFNILQGKFLYVPCNSLHNEIQLHVNNE